MVRVWLGLGKDDGSGQNDHFVKVRETWWVKVTTSLKLGHLRRHGYNNNHGVKG